LIRDLQITDVAPAGSVATAADLARVEEQLGRLPRGVWAVGARDVQGDPLVVVTQPRLPNGTPFPTLFYLTSPALVFACSTLEAEHVMADMNQAIPDAYASAHEDYLKRRSLLGEVPEISNFSAGGMPNRVKCLHALLAHTLAVGPGINPIGDQTLALINERKLWDSSPDWSFHLGVTVQ